MYVIHQAWTMMNSSSLCVMCVVANAIFRGLDLCKKRRWATRQVSGVTGKANRHGNTFCLLSLFNNLPTLPYSACPLRSRVLSRTARFLMVLSLPSPTCMPTLLAIEKSVNVDFEKQRSCLLLLPIDHAMLLLSLLKQVSVTMT